MPEPGEMPASLDGPEGDPVAPPGERVTLGPGLEVLIRPIRASDKQLLTSGFETLSPEARFLRFFAPVKRLDSSDLAYLTEIDHVDHEALVAIDPEDGELVGVARYVRTRPSNEAEVAVVVADRWNGRGLGTVLLTRLVRRASEEGIEYFLALVLVENSSAREFFENLVPGMSETSHSSPGQVEIRIDLPRPGDFEDSVLARVFRQSARGNLSVSPWRRLKRRLMRNRRPPAKKPD